MKGHKGHHHRHPRAEHAKGGTVGHFDSDASPSDVYAGGKSNVVKEAKERKSGGKAMGGKSAMRADRAPRKSGGRAGSNMNPRRLLMPGLSRKAISPTSQSVVKKLGGV